MGLAPHERVVNRVGHRVPHGRAGSRGRQQFHEVDGRLLAGRERPVYLVLDGWQRSEKRHDRRRV